MQDAEATSVVERARSAAATVDVDEAALTIFEQWALDIDGTRAAVEHEFGERVAETLAEAERATTIHDLRSQLARIERDL